MNVCLYLQCIMLISVYHFTLSQVRDEIERFGIKVYQFPECDSDEDEEFKQMDKELKVRHKSLKPHKSHNNHVQQQFALSLVITV